MSAAGPDNRKRVVVHALMEADGAYLPVDRLARLAYGDSTAAALNSTRALINEVRSTLRLHGAAASVLSDGAGEALRYAWSAGPSMPAEAAPGTAAPAITVGITLPALAGFTSCIFDDDSLVLDGQKQPRMRDR